MRVAVFSTKKYERELLNAANVAYGHDMVSFDSCSNPKRHRLPPALPRFQALSNEIIADDVIQRLVSFPNVIVTGHQAFFTREAVGTIISTTLESSTPTGHCAIRSC